MNLFTEVLKINFKDRQIDNLYWIGKRKQNRPLLVKFNNTITKDHIINKKRMFGRWKVRVEEDYSPEICTIRRKLIEYMWKERKNGNHAILSRDKILINGIPYDLEFCEKNHHLGPEIAEQNEEEITEKSHIDWGRISEELNKLKENIYSLRLDYTEESKTKIDRNQTIRKEDQTAKKPKKDTIRTLEIDSNWILKTTPGNLDQQGNEHGNYNISSQPTYRAESAAAYNIQETRPEATEPTKTSREENYDNFSKNKYFLRKRFK